jgi:hypothetical protein
MESNDFLKRPVIISVLFIGEVIFIPYYMLEEAYYVAIKKSKYYKNYGSCY